jgi:hypothetical protein
MMTVSFFIDILVGFSSFSLRNYLLMDGLLRLVFLYMVNALLSMEFGR